MNLTPESEIEEESNLSSSEIEEVRSVARDLIEQSDDSAEVLDSDGIPTEKPVSGAESGETIVVWPTDVDDFVSQLSEADETEVRQYFAAGHGVGFSVN